MQTVFLLLCPPKPPIWSGRSQTICWISCLAKVSKLVRNILPDGDQLTIHHLASLERPERQKTNLRKLCKNLSKIFDPYKVDTMYTCESLCAEKRYSWCGVRCCNRAAINTCAGKRYSWCGVRCCNRAAINTFRSHSVQWLQVFRSHPSTYPCLFQHAR